MPALTSRIAPFSVANNVRLETTRASSCALILEEDIGYHVTALVGLGGDRVAHQLHDRRMPDEVHRIATGNPDQHVRLRRKTRSEHAEIMIIERAGHP